MAKKNIYVFGPVPSRRLGRSLGIDLVPFKTCSYNCIYCQLGRTTNQTIIRKNYVPISEVMDQLWRKLDEGEQPDYITLSGSGEPTLHSEVGSLIKRIKERSRLPVAALTNGSLFWDEAVRAALIGADVVIPSLDAGEERLFQEINRPHPALVFERVVEGLVDFRKRYSGQIWLEIFLIEGMNTLPAALEALSKEAKRISADRIQLNTVIRPPAEEYALKVPDEEMERIREFFKDAEIIAPYHKLHVAEKQRITDEVLALLIRRPCTLEDISNGLEIHQNEALKHLQSLIEQNLLRQILRNGVLYYQAQSKR